MDILCQVYVDCFHWNRNSHSTLNFLSLVWVRGFWDDKFISSFQSGVSRKNGLVRVELKIVLCMIFIYFLQFAVGLYDFCWLHGRNSISNSYWPMLFILQWCCSFDVYCNAFSSWCILSNFLWAFAKSWSRQWWEKESKHCKRSHQVSCCRKKVKKIKHFKFSIQFISVEKKNNSNFIN